MLDMTQFNVIALNKLPSVRVYKPFVDPVINANIIKIEVSENNMESPRFRGVRHAQTACTRCSSVFFAHWIQG